MLVPGAVNALMFGGSSGSTVGAADFDGTNDDMVRGAALTGIADGKQGTFSGWVRLDAGDGASMQMFSIRDLTAGIQALSVERASDNKFRIRARDVAGTSLLTIATNSTFQAGGSWLNVLSSWDVATAGARHLYINNVDEIAVATFTDGTINYNQVVAPNNWIGQSGSGSLFNGCMAEFFFHTTYIDLSIAGNRAKFISGGHPVSLGANGSTPLGVQPLMYQRVASGAAVTTFATNLGTGGNFSITGSLDLCTTNP